MTIRRKIAAALLFAMASVVAFSAPAAADAPDNAPTNVSARVSSVAANGDVSVIVKWNYQRATGDQATGDLAGFYVRGSQDPETFTALTVAESNTVAAADAAADGTHATSIVLTAAQVEDLTDGTDRSDGEVYFFVYAFDGTSELSAAGVTYAVVEGAGDTGVDSVKNDSPSDAVNVIRDYGLENAPIIIGVIGAIFLVGLTFYLVRRGLMKARGAMRL